MMRLINPMYGTILDIRILNCNQSNMKTKLQYYQRTHPTNSSSEIGQLTSIIDKSLKENRQLYKQIVQIDSSLNFDLYSPIKHNGVALQFLKPLLLKQIDHLIQQKNALLKKQSEIEFKCEQGIENKEDEPRSHNNYTALRQAWTKFDNRNIDGIQHIDNLNKIVGMVRKNINRIIISEKEENTYTSKLNVLAIEEATNFQYHKLKKQDIQRVKMRNQELEGRILSLTQALVKKNQFISSLQTKIRSVEFQSSQNKQIAEQSRNRIKQIQQRNDQLIGKIQQLELKQQKTSKVYESVNGEFVLKVEGDKVDCATLSSTKRTLQEIILFLNHEKYETKSIINSQFASIDLDFKEKQCENDVPMLDLGASRNQVLATLTQRSAFKPNRFISYKTPRSGLNASFNPQKQHNTTLNNEQNDSNTKSRKFNRRGNVGAPTERPRLNKTIADIDFSIGLNQSVRNKLEKAINI